MITIKIDNVGKRHQNQWIFRGLNFSFSTNDKVAITGFNGSGKSTLLQILSGYQNTTEGQVTFKHHDKIVDINEWYKLISIGAPYIDIPEELTIDEFIKFFAPLKPLANANLAVEFAEIAQLGNARGKAIKRFSSGMKQRVKIAFAVLSNAPILLLDEPLSNLDVNGEKWYREIIANYTHNKLVFVASNNIENEIFFCNNHININQFK